MTSALERLRALRATQANQPVRPAPVVVKPVDLAATVDAMRTKHRAESGFSKTSPRKDPTKLTEPHPDTHRDPERVGSVGSVGCQLGGLSKNHGGEPHPPDGGNFSKDTPGAEATKLTEPSRAASPSSEGWGSVGSVGSHQGGALENHVVDEAIEWRDAFEERAAIREHCGGLPRAEAEAAALNDLASMWRNENPLPASDRAICCHCGEPKPDTPVLAGGGNAWMHARCWAPMNATREKLAREAINRALGTAMAIAPKTTDAARGGGDASA